MNIWTAAKEKKLREMWMGSSGAAIARAIGGGVTRNAVISKGSRLGLPAKKTTAGSGVRTGIKNPKLGKILTLPVAASGSPEPIGDIEEMGVVGGCSWIHGDVAQPGWRMCGHPVIAKRKPFCEFHSKRAHVPKPKTDATADAA